MVGKVRESAMLPMEFASPAWLAFFSEHLAAHLRSTEPTQMLTRCEVYTDAPAHLCSGASTSIAWTCRNAFGDIRFEAVECTIDDAHVKTIGDYAAFRELVRFVVTPENAGEFQALVLTHVESGRIKSLKDTRSQKPAPEWSLHNLIAESTG
jgi:hypothetical protein